MEVVRDILYVSLVAENSETQLTRLVQSILKVSQCILIVLLHVPTLILKYLDYIEF